jgi:hypothetical protein
MGGIHLWVWIGPEEGGEFQRSPIGELITHFRCEILFYSSPTCRDLVVLKSDLQDNLQVNKEVAISSIWRFATAQYLRLNGAQRGPSWNVFATPSYRTNPI